MKEIKSARHRYDQVRKESEDYYDAWELKPAAKDYPTLADYDRARALAERMAVAKVGAAVVVTGAVFLLLGVAMCRGDEVTPTVIWADGMTAGPLREAYQGDAPRVSVSVQGLAPGDLAWVIVDGSWFVANPDSTWGQPLSLETAWFVTESQTVQTFSASVMLKRFGFDPVLLSSIAFPITLGFEINTQLGVSGGN